MIRKLSKKECPKPVLEGEQLQALVTDLTETKEVALVGGSVEPIYVGSINRAQQKY